MIDFAINDKGDLMLSEQPTLPKFNLKFRLAEHKGLKVFFFSSPIQPPETNNNFHISFHTASESNKEKYLIDIVDDIDDIIQQIKIRLRTELTELPQRQNIGSEINIIKHSRLNSQDNLRRIENTVKASLADIIEDIDVVAKAELGTGFFFCQNVNIYIYSDGKMIYKFNI